MDVALQPEKDAAVKNKSLAKKRRVVVTGLGVVSSLGHDAGEFYNNLLEGVSGITEIEAFDCSEFPTVSLLLFTGSQSEILKMFLHFSSYRMFNS